MKSPIARLIELSLRCQVKEFDGPLTPQEIARKKGQTPDGNFARAVGTNLLVGAGYPALPATIANANDAQEADQVYRKRDAFNDGWRQGGGIIGGTLAGAGAGAGGSIAGHKIEEALAKRAGRNFMVSPTIVNGRAKKAGIVGAGLGYVGGAVGGYKWARKAGEDRIQKNKQMSAIDRLVELSSRCSLKEFDFLGLTKQAPAFNGPQGQFSGMQTKVNPAGVATDAAVVGGGAAAGVGLGALHNSIMNNYGDSGLASDAYNLAGRNMADTAGVTEDLGAKVGGAASKVGGLLDNHPNAEGLLSKLGSVFVKRV